MINSIDIEIEAEIESKSYLIIVEKKEMITKATIETTIEMTIDEMIEDVVISNRKSKYSINIEVSDLIVLPKAMKVILKMILKKWRNWLS